MKLSVTRQGPWWMAGGGVPGGSREGGDDDEAGSGAGLIFKTGR